jgi:chromosome partitioning protein
MPHIIVFGNEKGGSGKSTTAMHLMMILLRMNFSVGSLDLDARQGTLTRYLTNRRNFALQVGVDLECPEHHALLASSANDQEKAQEEDQVHFQSIMDHLAQKDFIIIDTPGANTHLSRLAHQLADTLITPLNDSFVDLDILANIDLEGKKILQASVYSHMVWEHKKYRAASYAGGHKKNLDWVVMRNRVSHQDARSKRQMASLLADLSKRVGFRTIPGFGERVIYRDLFPKGLTLVDMREKKISIDWTMAHLAARQELRNMMQGLALPQCAKLNLPSSIL